MALAAALVVPAALIASPPAGGQGRGHGHGGFGGPHDGGDAPRAMRMLHGLELEPAQRETIIELLESSRAGLDASHGAAKAIRDEIRKARESRSSVQTKQGVSP